MFKPWSAKRNNSFSYFPLPQCVFFISCCIRGTGWEQCNTPSAKKNSVWLWEENYLRYFSVKEAILIQTSFWISTRGSGARGKRPQNFGIKTVDRAFTFCFFPPSLPNWSKIFIFHFSFVFWQQNATWVPTWMLNILLRGSNESKVSRISTGLNVWRKYHASVGSVLIVLLCNMRIRIQKVLLHY